MTRNPGRRRSGWRDGLTRAFRRSEPARPDRPEVLVQEVEELILGGPRRYSRAQLLGESDLSPELAVRIWSALGFAEVPDGEPAFTDGDREALHEVGRLRQAGLVPVDVEEAVSRSIGQAMAGLADWQVEMLYQTVGYGEDSLDNRQMLAIAQRVLPLLERMQTYVWRRHLAAAAGRVLAAEPGESDTRELTVGFADLVGFSRMSRRLSPAQLTALIEDFHGVTTEVVVNCHGRVIKTVGDEVLFVADRCEDGAEIAVRLLEQLAERETLPDLRIGLAVGPVVTRFGDVYGEPVNIAARLTTHGRPGVILVDRNLAAAMADDRRFALQVRRPLAVRGYRQLHTWSLTRAGASLPA